MTAGLFTQYINLKIVKIPTSIALLRLTIFLKFIPAGIFNVSLTTKGFVFLINFACSSFDLLQRWVRGFKMTFCVAI